MIVGEPIGRWKQRLYPSVVPADSDMGRLMESLQWVDPQLPMSLGAEFCSQLRSIFEADLVSLNGLNADLSLAWAVDSPTGSCHGAIAEGVARLAPVHPSVRWGSQHVGQPARLDEFHTWSSLRRTPLYTDIYRPLGMRHEVIMVVNGNRGPVAVAMQRAGSDFDASVEGRLLMLSPVLALGASVMWSAFGHLPTAGATSPESQRSTLTPREQQVLRLLADGARDHDIGHVCGISTVTAKKHVEHILAKLNTGTRAGAVATGFRQRLIPPA